MEWAEIERRIRDAFVRWSSGDYELDREWIHPDVEILSITGTLSGDTYRGYDGVRRWTREMSDSFDEWTLTLDELEEVSPTRVLAVGSFHMRGRGSGLSVDQPCGWILDHLDGRLTRLEAFANRVDEARAIAARG